MSSSAGPSSAFRRPPRAGGGHGSPCGCVASVLAQLLGWGSLARRACPWFGCPRSPRQVTKDGQTDLRGKEVFCDSTRRELVEAIITDAKRALALAEDLREKYKAPGCAEPRGGGQRGPAKLRALLDNAVRMPRASS